MDLRKRRKNLNLTLKEVAEACNVSEGTVSRWEKGEIANMRKDRIEKLANALKVSPSQILEISDDMPKTSPTLTPHEEKVIDAYREADPVTQGNIDTLLHVEKEEQEDVEIFKKDIPPATLKSIAKQSGLTFK